MDSMLNAAPSIIKVEYTAGDPTFTIVVDTKNHASVGFFNLILRGQLENYLDSKPLD